VNDCNGATAARSLSPMKVSLGPAISVSFQSALGQVRPMTRCRRGLPAALYVVGVCVNLPYASEPDSLKFPVGTRSGGAGALRWGGVHRRAPLSNLPHVAWPPALARRRDFLLVLRAQPSDDVDETNANSSSDVHGARKSGSSPTRYSRPRNLKGVGELGKSQKSGEIYDMHGATAGLATRPLVLTRCPASPACANAATASVPWRDKTRTMPALGNRGAPVR
jgi:hypothetical protein